MKSNQPDGDAKYATGDEIWGQRWMDMRGGERATIVAPFGEIDSGFGRVYLVRWKDGSQERFFEAWMRPWSPESEARYRAEEAQERQRLGAARAYYAAERAGLLASDGFSQAPGLVGNKAIEDAAIAFVIEHEQRAGRQPNDTRYRGAPADLESGGRVIEVKAAGRSVRSSGFLMLEERQVKEAKENPNFYVYVVENIAQGDPAKFELRVIGGETLQRLIAGAKQRRYFEVPLPAKEHERLPRE